MFVKIPEKLFSDTISLLDATITRKVLLDKVNMSNQWLYNLTQQGNEFVKIKKDKWLIIKSLAFDTINQQQQTINALRDF